MSKFLLIEKCLSYKCHFIMQYLKLYFDRLIVDLSCFCLENKAIFHAIFTLHFKQYPFML